MRKLFTLSIVLALAVLVQGQTVLFQDFSQGIVPPAGWSLESQPNNWKISQTNLAGGIAPEGKLTWTPQFNGMARMVSPAVNLTGHNMVLVKFRYSVDHYSSSYQIGLATRSGGAGGTFNTIWSKTVTTSIPGEQILVIVQNSDVNKPDFQLAIFFNGNSYNLNDWYFDDIEVIAPYNLDASMESLAIPPFFTGEMNVGGKIMNAGINVITSLDVNWQLEEGDIFTTSFSGLNLSTGQVLDFSCNDPINHEPGNYMLNVWVSNVNSLGDDNNPANDMISRQVGIATNSMQRKPLFEEFTSSTCPPCATFNTTVMNPFLNQYGNNIALIKYQMNWPGSGDPYYTAEGGIRRTFYGVNAVPAMFIEGKNVATNMGGVTSGYNAGMADPAFMLLTAQHVIDGENITVQTDIDSYIDVENVRVHMVVIENETTGNVGSNGETSFKHVMMKMLPNANGTLLNLTTGEPAQLIYNHNMSTTHVEEMNDLAVVVFVQNHSNKMVFQSEYSVEVGAFVSFEPQNGSTQIPVDSEFTISFSQPVRMLDGSDITEANVASLITFRYDDENGNDVPFTATINETKTEIAITPDSNLEPLTVYYLAIAQVENMLGIPTLAQAITFITDLGTGIEEVYLARLSVYPNPVNNILNVVFNHLKGNNARLYITDMHGKFVYSSNLGGSESTGKSMIDVSSFPKGVYVLTLKTSQEIFSKRFIVLE